MKYRAWAASFALLVSVGSPSLASDKFYKTFADVGALGIPIAATAISIYEHDHNGLVQGAETVALALTATEVLKYSIDERRPNGGHYSFPSGHTALAFSGAGYLHARYGWKVGLPFELIAAGVGYSRVKTRDHHWYDVVAGAAIGEGSAFLLTRRLSENVRVSVGGDTTDATMAVAARF